MTDPKIKTREGSGYLKQLYSTARVTAGQTHSHLKNLTTFLVNFVPVDKVDPSELQVRVHFDDSEIEALANSIKEHGVLQPILVVQDGDRYKVIAGERRLRASKLAGIERIPARVLSTNDKATHEIALRENLDRVDLHPIEEGEGYLSLLEAQSYTSHDSIAKGFGKKKSRITECISYTKLPKETKFLLLKYGIKSRSLLRNLLQKLPEEHAKLIEEARKQEALSGGEELDPLSPISTSSEQPLDLEVKAAIVSSKERPSVLWMYTWENATLKSPPLKWKASEGLDKLADIQAKLKVLCAEIEEKLATKSSEKI